MAQRSHFTREAARLGSTFLPALSLLQSLVIPQVSHLAMAADMMVPNLLIASYHARKELGCIVETQDN